LLERLEKTAQEDPGLKDVLRAIQGLGSPDPASPLALRTWIKGDPNILEQRSGNHMLVVVLWRSACPASGVSIPLLTRLQKEYRNKGLTVVAVSNEAPDVVRTFVAQRETAIDFAVAVDDKGATIAALTRFHTSLRTPHAFVIDTTGSIVWDGHPQGGLETVVRSLVAGTYSRMDCVTDLLEGKEPNLRYLSGTRELVAAAGRSSWSPQGTHLVYPKPEGKGLVVLDTVSGLAKDLTAAGNAPAWSPDGRFIAFVRRPVDPDGAPSEVCLVSPSGGAPRRLTEGSTPTWAAEGKTLYVYRKKENRLFSVAIDDPKSEPTACFELEGYTNPSVSPDGSRVAVFKPDMGELIILDRKTRKRLVTWMTVYPSDVYAAWSPDATAIIFTNEWAMDPGLWLLDVEGRDICRLLRGNYSRPAWSRDGSKVSFTWHGNDPKARELWVADAKTLLAMRTSRYR
jgi:hypothetical protein